MSYTEAASRSRPWAVLINFISLDQAESYSITRLNLADGRGNSEQGVRAPPGFLAPPLVLFALN
jgi:hypothetical protein